MKRWPWATLVSFVVGVLIWHGVFRMPRPDPAPESAGELAGRDSEDPPPQPAEAGSMLQPSAAGEVKPEARIDTLQAREDELAFMQRLRELRDPGQALELAREGNRRFPAGSSAAERGAIISRSLVKLGRFSEARDEAERLLHDYPETPWALEVEAQTGAP